MLKFLLGLAALFATMMPSWAWAAIGEIDPAFVRSEIPCNDPADSILDSLRSSDSGGMFGICATRKSAPGRSDTDYIGMKTITSHSSSVDCLHSNTDKKRRFRMPNSVISLNSVELCKMRGMARSQ